MKNKTTRSGNNFVTRVTKWGGVMQDKTDRATPDLFTGKLPPGRPRKYASNAEKQRAYRQRYRQKAKQQSVTITGERT